MASGNERHLRAHRRHPRRQTPRARIRGENQRHRPETHDTTHVAVHRHRHAIRILSASEAGCRRNCNTGRTLTFAGWLKKNQTTSPRFDARCVHAIDDMNHDERQVQADGQIKSGDRGFHGSKGLRRVIGFMNEQSGRTEKPTRQGRQAFAERRPSKAKKMSTSSACCKTSTSSRTNRSRHAMEQNRRERTAGDRKRESAGRLNASRKRLGTRPTANRTETAQPTGHRRKQKPVSSRRRPRPTRRSRTSMARRLRQQRLRRRHYQHGIEPTRRRIRELLRRIRTRARPAKTHRRPLRP